MVDKHDMVIIGTARYRYEDAKRLGLIADGKVITARSVERPPSISYAHNHRPEDNADGTPENSDDSGDKTPETPQDDSQDAETKRPARNASKGDWKAYALSQGRTEADLDGLTRDQISELFPDDDSETTE